MQRRVDACCSALIANGGVVWCVRRLRLCGGTRKLSDGLFLQCCRDAAKAYEGRVQFEEMDMDRVVLQVRRVAAVVRVALRHCPLSRRRGYSTFPLCPLLHRPCASACKPPRAL